MSDPTPTTGETVFGHALFAVAVAAISALLAWQVVPEVLQGEMFDPDNYMRLLRVEKLLETGVWFDAASGRSNAPFGEVLHWTRPLDILIAAGAVPLKLFMPLRTAVYWAGFLISPLLLVFICFAMAWVVVPLVGARYRYYAMISVLAQIGVVGYAVPGRPDHHPLVLLLFVLGLGLSVRLLMRPFARRLALATGSVFGLGLWVGPEFLVPLALLLVSTGILWLLAWEDIGRKNLWFGVGLLMTLVVALMLERPPQDWLSAEYDRLSIVYVAMGALILAVLAGLRFLEARFGGTTGRRLLLAGGMGLAGALTMLAIYPRFFGGPTVDADPVLLATWLANVEEYQAFPLVPTLAGVGYLIAFLGPVMFCLPFLAWILIRQRDSTAWGAWFLITASLLGFIPLAILRFRFVAYPELLTVPVIMAILARLHARVEHRPEGFTRSLLRAGSSAVLITGSLWLGAVLVTAGGMSPRVVREAQVVAGEVCHVSALAPVLNNPRGLGSRSQTILAHLDLGPEILYRTNHRVLGTPYHRNAAGILDGRRILRSPVSEGTRRLMAEREIDLILHCPAAPTLADPEPTTPAPTTPAPEGEADSRPLYARLESGDLPGWIEQVPVPEDQAGGFLVFRVVAE